ncbi:alpha-amylase family protein [Pelagovum pacificum]|uniref:Beta-galactosidase n=1 Tax=Pelagovum pacificum TaxID=2588711 RepID=A0A5C5GEA3_9RHOB|nr:alpha-amylase family protein [Pelagovum pacificum]QQA44337.1 beta-galactosidase trimerization domain-containing protein [Pelagovum pacificum]TNY32544.1 beta-galactosidase [Pelagovum pacificum]
MLKKNRNPLRYRQIHLDFHTSEHIPGIGAAFDPEEFVSTLQAAHVDSITLFAKCHHGWSYYPTEVGAPHPHLEREDLLGDMVTALKAADIECPIYITVQWDERNSRLHPEWRVCSAGEDNPFAPGPLDAAWHTLCLNHEAYRAELLEHAREVVRRYDPPGLFFDIILTPSCACAACMERMTSMGRDPSSAADRLSNDEEVNEIFRSDMTKALREEFPDLRIFYNCGHIHKQGAKRFEPYSHLELESLPTGGWGYDHFPSSARYAATLGLDFVAHTGKFHTTWGEFGGFKHPDALEFECAQMVALGSKCLVGDQLHPNGRINADTYRSIAPAYARVEKLEPYLDGARQISEIAVLSAEHFSHEDRRNHPSDDGATQMLQELKYPFDVVDSGSDLSRYKLIILPDDISLDEAMTGKLRDFHKAGGKLLASDRSGLSADGTPVLPLGLKTGPERHPFDPSYIVPASGALPSLPAGASVVYGSARKVEADGAEVLATVHRPYFNRSYAHFCSHQHAPDDPDAAPLGPAATIHDGIGYVAYPIFDIYRQVGQPIYKYLVGEMISRLLPDPVLTTDLPSSGRASISVQEDQNRHVLHLLYGPPQIRGKSVAGQRGETRVMEMIEDIPAIGPVRAEVRLPKAPKRAFDAMTGEELEVTSAGEGCYAVTIPRLHIHSAIVFEESV